MEIAYYVRKKVRERDNDRCQICGKALESYEGHIHHLFRRNGILPEWTGLNNENDIVNLILLCGKCHQRIHTPP
ncbi:MAG: HNH endonuclease, partial [Elusimicrobiota bacterium]